MGSAHRPGGTVHQKGSTMPRRSARSRSRGRTDTYKAPVPTPKAKVPKTPKAEPKPKLDFAEGAAVMARWPGSSLFFKAKVTLVREEEQEYDVEFENGTVYTLKKGRLQGRLQGDEEGSS